MLHIFILADQSDSAASFFETDGTYIQRRILSKGSANTFLGLLITHFIKFSEEDECLCQKSRSNSEAVAEVYFCDIREYQLLAAVNLSNVFSCRVFIFSNYHQVYKVIA